MSAVRKIFLCLTFFLFFLFLKTPVFAQTQTNTQTTNQYLTPNTNPDVAQNLHTWTQNVMLEVMSAMNCQLVGMDPTTPNQKCLGQDPKTGKIGYVNSNGGLLGFTTNAIAYLYVPPAHTVDYIRYLSDNFGIAKPSYAQLKTGGYGLDSLKPIQNLWITFRNLVYVLFVIVFLVIGIAIMFRVKIDPRTVMTIQNQIPKIIIGIILVTFSLAIAGFLIDLMYVVSYLLTGVIASAGLQGAATNTGLIINSTNPINAANAALTHNGSVLNGLGDLSLQSSQAIGGHLGDLFDNPFGRLIVGAVTGIFGLIAGGSIASSVPVIGSLIGSAVGFIVGGLFGPQILSTILSAIGFLIIVVALIAALFRLWFQLLMAYINIIVDIIFAPIWIAGGLIPGSKINFSSWLRSLLANLAAFPAVLVMFTLARVIMDQFGQDSQNYFVPPLIGNPATPGEIGSLIGLGFVLAAPSVVKMMKTIFGAPQMGFGPILGGLLTGVNVLRAGARPIAPRLYSRRYDPVKREYFSSGALARPISGLQGRFFGNKTNPTVITRLADTEVGVSIGNLRRRVSGQPERELVQGPVPINADERHFRRTGNTRGGTGGTTGGGGGTPPPAAGTPPTGTTP